MNDFEVTPIDEEGPSIIDELPTEDTDEEPVIDDIQDDPSVPEGGEPESTEEAPEPEPDLLIYASEVDELPTEDTDEQPVIDDEPDGGEQPYEPDINDNVIDIPIVGSAREGDVIPVLMRSGAPLGISPVGGGDRMAKEVTSAWTAIESNSEQIALKANSTDVYTKTQTDGLISQEVTDRNSAIEQSAESITSSVSATYATKSAANPNLSPFFSAAPVEVGDWWTFVQNTKTAFTPLDDGWVHVRHDNTNGTKVSRTDFEIKGAGEIEPGADYTFLFEFRNNDSTGSNTFYIVQSARRVQFWGGVIKKNIEGANASSTSTNLYDNFAPGTDGVYRKRFVKVSEAADSTYLNREGDLALCCLTIYVSPGFVAEYDVRVSIYEGEYLGPYKPYSDQVLRTSVTALSTRVTQTEADVTTAINGVNGLNALVRQYGQGVLVCRKGNTIGALVNANGSFGIVTVTWDGATPTAGATVGQVSASRATFLSGNANIVAHANGGLRLYGTSQNNALILADAWEDSAGNTYSGVTFNQILAWSYMESIETATVLEVIRAAKRKRTVLYNNASGSNGTITLSKSAAKFDHMRIYFRDVDDSAVDSVDVYSPNSKKVALSMSTTIPAQNQTWLKTRMVNISGTSVTNVSTRYANTNATYYSDFQKTNVIYIIRVEGWLEVHPGLI